MKDEKEILELVDCIDLEAKEYDSVMETLTEIDKKRLKRNFKRSLKVKNNRVKKSIAAACCLALVILVGTFLYKPAFADYIPFIQPIYEKLGYYKEYLDYTSYIGKSVKDKGYTFTVDNIVGTKDRLLIAIKIESSVPFTQESKNGFMCFANSDGVKGGGSSSYHSYFENDKTLILLLETRSNGGYKKRGNLHISIHSLKEYVKAEAYANFNFKVDFSKSFASSITVKTNQSFTIDHSTKKIYGLESNPLGTVLKGNAAIFDSDTLFTCLLKVDDVLYTTSSSVSCEDEGTLFFNAATYDRMKNAKNISLIPIEFLIKWKERLPITDAKYKELKAGPSVIESGIEYPSKVYFEDSRVGDFYKVEKVGDMIKIYFKVEGEILPFLSHLYLDGYYSTEKTENTLNREYYDGIIYKDKNVPNGYVKEFKVNKETNFTLGYFKEPLMDGIVKTVPEVKLK